MNATGVVVWRWELDAFGIGAANQNPGGAMQFEFNARLPGQQFDAETGLYYNNARYYDPVTGRYISSDPIGLAGGVNTYGYAGGNPVGLVDPAGLDVWIEKGNWKEPFLHQSISIGSPQGFYVSYSYGVVTAPFQFGAVYADYSLGGLIEQYKRTTPLQDIELIQRIGRLVGTAPGLYGVTDICRSWSQKQFEQAPGRVAPPLVVYATRDGFAPKEPRNLRSYTSVLSMPFSSVGTSTSR